MPPNERLTFPICGTWTRSLTAVTLAVLLTRSTPSLTQSRAAPLLAPHSFLSLSWDSVVLPQRAGVDGEEGEDLKCRGDVAWEILWQGKGRCGRRIEEAGASMFRLPQFMHPVQKHGVYTLLP